MQTFRLFKHQMSVGASTTHNIVRYQDESYSECQCVKRNCVICNPNPTSDLIFEQRDVNDYIVAMNDRNFRDLDKLDYTVTRLHDLYKDTQSQVRMLIELNEILTRKVRDQQDEIARMGRALADIRDRDRD